MPNLQQPLWRRILEAAILGVGIGTENKDLIGLWQSWDNQRQDLVDEYKRNKLRRDEAMQTREWRLKDEERGATLQDATRREQRGQEIGDFRAGQALKGIGGTNDPEAIEALLKIGQNTEQIGDMPPEQVVAMAGRNPDQQALTQLLTEKAMRDRPEYADIVASDLAQQRGVAEMQNDVRADQPPAPNSMNAQILRYENELAKTMPDLPSGQRMRLAAQMFYQDSYQSRKQQDPFDQMAESAARESMPGMPPRGQLEIPSWPGADQQGPAPQGPAPQGPAPQMPGTPPPLDILNQAVEAGLIPRETVGPIVKGVMRGDERAIKMLAEFTEQLQKMAEQQMFPE